MTPDYVCGEGGGGGGGGGVVKIVVFFCDVHLILHLNLLGYPKQITILATVHGGEENAIELPGKTGSFLQLQLQSAAHRTGNTWHIQAQTRVEGFTCL